MPRGRSPGILDPAAPDAADQLSYWVHERGMKGVRLQSQAEPDDPRCDPPGSAPQASASPSPSAAEASRRRSIGCGMGARHPNVLFAPDHFAGWSGAEDKAAMTTALERLAKLPNAYVRISSTSLGSYAALTPPEKELFRRVIAAFTPRRHVGLQLPSSRAGGYIGQVQLGQTALSWLSDDDRRWIMGETAHTLWPMLQGPARGSRPPDGGHEMDLPLLRTASKSRNGWRNFLFLTSMRVRLVMRNAHLHRESGPGTRS